MNYLASYVCRCMIYCYIVVDCIGSSTATGQHGRVQSFLYDAENPTGPPLDNKQHQLDAIKATETGSPV